MILWISLNVNLVHLVILLLKTWTLMCFYFIIDTQQTIQWCEAAIIKSHCLQNTILLNNASSLWPGVTADLAKVTSNVVIGQGNNNNNDRVQTNNSITPLKQGSVSTMLIQHQLIKSIPVSHLHNSRSVYNYVHTYVSPTSCNNHIWFLVQQKEDSMHWQKTKYIFCSGKRNEIFCSFDCNLKLFFQCFRSASFSN